jgi:PilZ domain-containing protein
MLARSRESRKSMRRWMRREAEVILEPHKLPIRCVIHDLSNGGARLSFTAPLRDLPRSITLVLFKDSVQRDCEIVWTDGYFIGVKFVSEWFGTKSSEPGTASKSSREESRGHESNA